MKIIAFALFAFCLPAAFAQERVFLPKAQVQELASGKIWTHARTADKQKVRWELKADGSLTANNLTSLSRDSGTWSVNDRNELCVKWRGKSQDRCVALLREGDKLKMVDSTDLAGSYADVVVE